MENLDDLNIMADHEQRRFENKNFRPSCLLYCNNNQT